MKQVTLNGITWDHRRAVSPLTGTAARFARRHPEISIEWRTRPLSAFEFTSVDKLAEDYDFIILDHPFCGAVAASGSLLPLDGIVADISDRFAGPSLASYQMAGKTWALPVDAATQVMALRPDLLDRLGAQVPDDWQAMMALGAKARSRDLWLAIGFKGVHSLMTFFSLIANLGSPCATSPGQQLCNRAAAREALDLMKALLEFCPADVVDWNSIKLHDVMSERDDLIACPAVYCYATYAENDQRRPLRFHDFPGPSGPRGTAIGGTGLGVSAHSKHADAAITYARFAAEAETQLEFARHHGQPARIEAWDDPSVNTIFGNCFRDTRATLNNAWIRPRYKGYVSFQEKAGDLVERHLREAGNAEVLIDRLFALHAQSGKE